MLGAAMSIFPARSPFRRRHERCYELSLKTLLDLNDAGKADGVNLVHGTVASPINGFAIGHVWLECDGEAYDAVDHVTMPVWGPWHKTEGIY
jgi:hypothetical protein